MSLRNRLFALVSAAVALTVVLVTTTVSSSARRAFAAVDAQRAAAVVAQIRREFAARGEQVAMGIERIAASDVILRMAGGIGQSKADFVPYVGEAAPLAAAQALDFLDLVADSGTIISSAHWPARFGYQHPWAAEASRTEAGSGRAFLQKVELPGEVALGLIATRTVAAGEHRLHVAGGRRLDQHFLEALVLPAGTRVLLYRNLGGDASRQQVVDASGVVPDAALLEPLIARVRKSGEEARETIEWPEPETVAAIPLRGRDGSILGVLLVGSSGRELSALVARIRWSGAAFGALGIVFGFALSYLLASRVTRPVEQLADAARAVASGDWNVQVDSPHASAEIADLARAFGTMTRQLADQRDRLVQVERVAAWRELARRLAHELKNPLFPLRITTDNLRRARALPPGEFDEVFEESMGTLTTGLSNLNTVIGRFSDFARMPAPEVSDVSPNAIVQETAKLFQAQLAAPGQPAITVTLDLDASAGFIRADGEQLARALQNLLLNGIDAMPQGGELTIRTRRSSGGVFLDVADTGEGLTDEERQRLFTPYYTTKQHGTGLGLAIVQSVVADHGGKISVDSEPARGTTFHIELPAGIRN
jgi:two-component system nitrogen regulation sensor histidine kinase NtrY